MPISIVPIGPSSIIGPGLPLLITSSLGVLPTGSAWDLEIHAPSSSETGFYFAQWPALSPQTSFHPYQHEGTISEQAPVQAVATGESTFVEVTLLGEGGTVQDQGSSTDLTWDATAGLGFQIQQLLGGIQGGLTDAQAQQLTNVEAATVPTVNLDGLGLVQLGGGPTSGFSAPLNGPIFGVIVRLTQIPDDQFPINADADYWRTTLARVSIFRAGDLWLRFPVHTQNRMFLLPGSEIPAGIAAIPQGAWLLNMSLQFSTLPGVLGEVFTMTLP